MRLDLFGINILSIGEHDHFLAPPGDKEIAAGIEVAQIAGVEPAVAQHLSRGLGTIPISLHYDRAADRNLTGRWRAFFHRLADRRSCASTPGKGLPTEPNTMSSGRIEKGAAGRFGEAVGVENVDSERVKVAGDRGIEARAAGHQIAHARAEGGVDLAEKKSCRR